MISILEEKRVLCTKRLTKRNKNTRIFNLFRENCKFENYIAPARKRNVISIRKSIRNADTNEKNDPNKAAADSTFCRPNQKTD